MAEEAHTPYLIWLHHSWLKRRGHQPKKIQTRKQSIPSLFLITVDVGRQDFTICLPDPGWVWVMRFGTMGTKTPRLDRDE
jgi:hypothetical protein